MKTESMPLHIKYRPARLDYFLGNQDIVPALKSIIERETGRPHAILFTGPSGCGKTTLARILKTEFKCSDSDFSEYNTANTRGIDTIREVVQNCQYFPLNGPIRMYLFDEVHMLTTEAMNALLKLLEDPPTHVYFILCTTDPEKLLKTIRNRCTSFEVKPLRRISLQHLLERVLQEEDCKEFPPAAIQKIIEEAEGSPRKALVILDKVIDIKTDEELLQAIQEVSFSEVSAIDFCRALLTGNWGQVVDILKDLEEDPERVRRAVLGYMSKVLMNPQKNMRASVILDAFTDPFFNGGKPLLVNASFKCCH